MINKQKSKKIIRFTFLFLYKKSTPYGYKLGNQKVFSLYFYSLYILLSLILFMNIA